MRFWDSSAIVPLMFEEETSAVVDRALEEDPLLFVWWATPVECVSAAARRERERTHSAEAINSAVARLDELAASWMVVNPAPSIAVTARRVLRLHPLRAADALQLAAAIHAANEDPRSIQFACFDRRLRDAAAREGFALVPVSME